MRVIACLVLVLGTAALGGCITGDRVRQIRLGMNQSQVDSIMGNPDGQKQEGDFIAYQYVNRLISGWSWDRADYNVIFNQGKVVQYGAGAVRQDENHKTLVIVPLR